jgi:hypothetical protein
VILPYRKQADTGASPRIYIVGLLSSEGSDGALSMRAAAVEVCSNAPGSEVETVLSSEFLSLAVSFCSSAVVSEVETVVRAELLFQDTGNKPAISRQCTCGTQQAPCLKPCMLHR